MKTYEEVNPQLGIKTTLHELDGKTVYQKTYDAQPFLDVAAERRLYSYGRAGNHDAAGRNDSA